MASMENHDIVEFVNLEKHKRELNDELRFVRDKIADLEIRLLDNFSNQGIQSMKVNGMTVYLSRDLKVSVREGQTQRLAEALKDNNLSELVKEAVNITDLKSHIVELDKDGDAIPEVIKEMLHIFEHFKLRTRKSS